MVTADFRTITDVTKLVISRPASASYTPSAIRAMLAVSDVRALLGMPHSAAQTIAVPLVNRKILQRWHDSERISHVIVTVGRQDAHLGKTYQGGKGELQVYQAVMHFDAHFSGLRCVRFVSSSNLELVSSDTQLYHVPLPLPLLRHLYRSLLRL